MWCPPTISLKWGAYFAPDTDDDAKIVDTAIKAHDANIITLRAAVQRVQRTFNIENVDQFVETLEEERQAKQDQLAADMHAMGAVGDDDNSSAKDVKKVGGKTVGKTVPKKTKKPGGE